MMPEDLSKMLASYLPGLVLRRIAENTDGILKPRLDQRQGAALVADVAGFTQLAEGLAKRGPHGAEQLTEVLNEYFGHVIQIVCLQGGDVVRFAGDALLVVWEAETTEGIELAVRLAARCALKLQAELQGYQTADGSLLAMKVGLGAGEFAVQHIGGILDRWEFLVSGLAFVQAFDAIDRASVGQVTASLHSWQYLADGFSGKPLPMGTMLVESEEEIAREVSSRPPDLESACQASLRGQVVDQIHSLRAYIPYTVIARISAGQSHWLGELRLVTVLFVSLPEMNYATPLERAQMIMQQLQTELYRYEGSINKLNVDDKGTALLAALGLPPLSHEDDAVRGVLAALAIQQKLRELGLRSSIGISTGRVFCGSFGSELRNEYTLLGDSVNLAARLMQSALGAILCDETTYRMASHATQFDCLSHVQLKGKAEAVTVYRPATQQGRAATKQGQSASQRGRQPAASTTMVGRRFQRDVLHERLRALTCKHQSSVVILEGEGGIGKSCLVQHTLTVAEKSAVRCLVGVGDAIETATLYYPWRAVFQQWFGLDGSEETAELGREKVLSQLADLPSVVQLAPLLSAVLPFDWPDNNKTRHMAGQVRGENTRDLLLHLLKHAAAQAPTLLVLEDVHWQDSSSWALTGLVARQAHPLMLLLVKRPFSDDSPEAYERIVHAPETIFLSLDRLSESDTEEIVCHCLGVSSIAEPILRFIHEKAEGHPLFTEEIAYALRDSQLITMEHDYGRARRTDEDFADIDFPNTLHGVITSRIDRLGASQQLAIKVASVIGCHFPYRALQAAYPIESEREVLCDHLAVAMRANLIEIEAPDTDIAYLFRHVITQQVAYELLLLNQREQLHRALAAWYEQEAADNLLPYYPVLARHWRHAGEPLKAVDYYDRAATDALHGGGYREAAEFLNQALALSEQAGLEIEPLRAARWQRQLGVSCLGLGKLPASRKHLEQCLVLLGYPPPSQHWSRVLQIARMGLGQVIRGLISRSRKEPQAVAPAVAEPNLEASRACEPMAETCYLSGETVCLLYSVFANLKYARRAGPSVQLARAYATNGVTAGLLGLHGLARAYSRKGPATARTLDDPAALAWALELMSLYSVGVGDFDRAEQGLIEAIEICERLGDWQHWGENQAALAQLAYYRGDARAGFERWNALHKKAVERGDQLQQAWGLNGRSEGLLRLGDGRDQAKVVELLRTALELFADNVDRISQIGSYGLLATTYLRGEQFEQALEAAEEAMRLARRIGPPTGYYALSGYSGAAQVYLNRWEADDSAGGVSWKVKARGACRALRRYARIFSIGQPRALLCRGLYQSCGGHTRAALRCWEQSIAAARQFGMVYDEAQAHYELGRHRPIGDPLRDAHLRQSRELFRQLQAGYELRQTERLLNGMEKEP